MRRCTRCDQLRPDWAFEVPDSSWCVACVETHFAPPADDWPTGVRHPMSVRVPTMNDGTVDVRALCDQWDRIVNAGL